MTDNDEREVAPATSWLDATSKLLATILFALMAPPTHKSWETPMPPKVVIEPVVGEVELMELLMFRFEFDHWIFDAGRYLYSQLEPVYLTRIYAPVLMVVSVVDA